MRSTRIIMFVIMIVLGVVLGLVYGWVINPVKYADTSPDMLHPSYKADYVLMVAQIYQQDGDLNQATQRLTLLGKQTPLQIASEGLKTARDLGYESVDQEQMMKLVTAFQQPTPAVPDGAKP